MGKKHHKTAAPTPAPLDDAPVPALGVPLWQLANAWQRTMRQALEPFGLTQVQFLLLDGLSTLLAQGEVPSQARLAGACQTDVMMTSQVVRALETAGLVTRQSHAGDKRSRVLAITPAGEEVLARARPAAQAADSGFFAPLGKKRGKLAKHLESLLQAEAKPSDHG